MYSIASTNTTVEVKAFQSPCLILMPSVFSVNRVFSLFIEVTCWLAVYDLTVIVRIFNFIDVLLLDLFVGFLVGCVTCVQLGNVWLFRKDCVQMLFFALYSKLWHSYCLCLPVSAVMRGQPNGSAGHTTDCRPAWNECQLNHCMECISSFNTHVSHYRPWFNIHIMRLLCCMAA